MERQQLLRALRDLSELYQSGGLTRQEFQATKELLLAQMRQLHAPPASSVNKEEITSPAFPRPKSNVSFQSNMAPSLQPEQQTAEKRTPNHEDDAFEALDSILQDLKQMRQKGALDDNTFQAGQQYLLQHLQANGTLPLPKPSQEQPIAQMRPSPSPIPPAPTSPPHPASLSSATPPHMAINQALVPGQTLLGRYYLEKLLGQGGMGQVFLCFDTIRQGQYALKVIHPHLAQYEDLRQRFLQELRVTERLTHPGIVRTYTLEQDFQSGFLFFTMEYVKGITLEGVLRQAEEEKRVPPFPLQTLISILDELVTILEYAHEQGIIHRDLKPSNIMVSKDFHVKLMDFGIAKVLEGTSISKHTGFGGFVYYMAPEQLKGGGIVSAASDVFSLGVITYQLLTGEIPMGSIEPPSALWTALPREVDQVVLKAMSPRTHQRYQTPRLFWEALLAAFEPMLRQLPMTKESARPTRPVSLDEMLEKLQQSDPQIAIEISENVEVPSQLAQQLLQDLSAMDIPDQTPYHKDLSSLHGLDASLDLDTEENSFSAPLSRMEHRLSQQKRLVLPPTPEGIEEKSFYAKDQRPLFQMVKIPAGCFLMGSPENTPDAYDNEQPQRTVHLDDYWISRTPITHQMWFKFVQESHYRQERPSYLPLWEKNRPPELLLDHPVVGIDITDAKNFARFYGLDLPSEAEWEKAARGSQGRSWAWGEKEPDPTLCNFRDSGLGRTTPVTNYPQGMSPFGLLDCCGNAWEWCGDHWNLYWLQEMGERPENPHYTDYHLQPQSPKQYSSRTQYSIRGGCYRYHARGIRCAFRFSASTSAPYIGFRVIQRISAD